MKKYIYLAVVAVCLLTRNLTPLTHAANESSSTPIELDDSSIGVRNVLQCRNTQGRFNKITCEMFEYTFQFLEMHDLQSLHSALCLPAFHPQRQQRYALAVEGRYQQLASKVTSPQLRGFVDLIWNHSTQIDRCAMMHAATVMQSYLTCYKLPEQIQTLNTIFMPAPSLAEEHKRRLILATCGVEHKSFYDIERARECANILHLIPTNNIPIFMHIVNRLTGSITEGTVDHFRHFAKKNKRPLFDNTSLTIGYVLYDINRTNELIAHVHAFVWKAIHHWRPFPQVEEYYLVTNAIAGASNITLPQLGEYNSQILTALLTIPAQHLQRYIATAHMFGDCYNKGRILSENHEERFNILRAMSAIQPEFLGLLSEIVSSFMEPPELLTIQSSDIIYLMQHQSAKRMQYLLGNLKKLLCADPQINKKIIDRLIGIMAHKRLSISDAAVRIVSPATMPNPIYNAHILSLLQQAPNDNAAMYADAVCHLATSDFDVTQRHMLLNELVHVEPKDLSRVITPLSRVSELHMNPGIADYTRSIRILNGLINKSSAPNENLYNRFVMAWYKMNKIIRDDAPTHRCANAAETKLMFDAFSILEDVSKIEISDLDAYLSYAEHYVGKHAGLRSNHGILSILSKSKAEHLDECMNALERCYRIPGLDMYALIAQEDQQDMLINGKSLLSIIVATPHTLSGYPFTYDVPVFTDIIDLAIKNISVKAEQKRRTSGADLTYFDIQKDFKSAELTVIELKKTKLLHTPLTSDR